MADRLLGAPEHRLERGIVEPAQHEHLRARQQRAIELEGRVLRGGTDQRDGAVLDIGEESILLCAIEAVDLVDEEERALSAGAPLLGRVEHFAEIGDAREHCRERLEVHGCRIREEPRDGSLAAAGRAPEHHRGEAMLRHHAADWRVRAEQMVLPHHLRQALRAQPIGERARGLILEETH